MLHHIGLNVSDLARSVTFYQAVLTALGYQLSERDEHSASFVMPSAAMIYITDENASRTTHRVHLAFSAKSRAEVDSFHAEGLRAGGVDHGKPGLRTNYAPNYYAAFLIDPDDNNIEAVIFES